MGASVVPIDVCDVGDVTSLNLCDFGVPDTPILRKVAMVVKAPRGRAVIFVELSPAFGYSDNRGGYLTQSLAVRAFMEQHRND